MIETVVMLVPGSLQVTTVADFKQLHSELVSFQREGTTVRWIDADPKMRCADLVLPSGYTESDVLDFVRNVAGLEDDSAVVEHGHDLCFTVEASDSCLIVCGDCGKNDVLANVHACSVEHSK